MTLKRHLFDVYVAPLNDADKPDFDSEPLEFLAVQVTQGDIIRAELEGNKQGLPNAQKAALTATTLWVWAALDRTDQVSCKWSEFRSRVIAVQALKDAAGEAATKDVDPTRPAPSGPPSSSPPTSEAAPATGSIPSSTTD